MSDTDGTFNFLISMIYTQMFNLLCEKADDVYGGRLPVHVRCLIDEAANIGQIPNLEKLVATIRSREISACLVLQAKSQLKAIYKDNADTIIGNMDSQIFLGGTEQTTLKDLNAILGKETIDMYNTGQSKGSQESYSMNYQKLGKEVHTIGDSPARTNTSFPSYSAISVSLCSSIRIHATSGLFSSSRISSHISAMEGRPKSQSLGAMESSAVFPSKNSSSVKRGRRSSFSLISFLNTFSSIMVFSSSNFDFSNFTNRN